MIELYSWKRIEGAPQQRVHALLTIYDKNAAPDYVKSAIEDKRVLYVDKEQALRVVPAVQFHGDIKESALKKKLSDFNQKVKQFKAENHIDDGKEAARRVDNGKGETLKEFFSGCGRKELTGSKCIKRSSVENKKTAPFFNEAVFRVQF